MSNIGHFISVRNLSVNGLGDGLIAGHRTTLRIEVAPAFQFASEAYTDMLAAPDLVSEHPYIIKCCTHKVSCPC